MGPQRVDPYEILGLEWGATWAEIREAYRRLAKKHHPDKNPGDKASEWIFKEVGRAYEHLRGVHGAHSQTGEGTRRERDPGRRSDYEHSERQARAQREREQRQRAERVRQEQERAERREREQREKRQAQAARERREQAQSERTARDSREGMGREQSGGRESAPRLSIVAVAVLLGITITTGIYDRADDTLPDRTAQSATQIEREATPARPPSTATASQGLVSVGQGSSTPSGPSPVPVRVGTDVSPSRAVQSAANAEREGAPARPPGAAMISQAPASVARSRAPERASTSPSGPRPPSAARVDNATVIGRRAADPPDRTEPPARTGASVTGSAFFTRGSHEDDVVRVQGTPARIDRYPSLGYETWEYDSSTVTISTGSRRVTDWSNRTGNLRVRLIPGANVTGSAFFTRGSYEDDVVRVQGTPARIDRYPSLGYETWEYDSSTVTISTGSRRVTDWSNRTGNLRVRLIPGANVTGSAFFTRGSHEDDVVRVQGTPARIDRYPSLGYETWEYDSSTVTISTGSRRVTDWSNRTGNLRVR